MLWSGNHSMLDTVKLAYYMEIHPNFLETWDSYQADFASGKCKRYYSKYYIKGSSIVISCVYRPISYTGEPLLSIEFSLPKLLFGSNLFMCNEIENSLNLACQIISDTVNIPGINYKRGILERIDPFWNFQLGEEVYWYVQTLQKLSYPHRRTKSYEGGVTYESRMVTTKFYDKERQMRNNIAHGILRMESTLRLKAIKKLFSMSKPCLNDITRTLLFSVLVKDLIRLNIYGVSFANKDSALTTLILNYGERGGLNRYGYLCAGIDKLKNQGFPIQIPQRTINRRKADINKSKIAPVLSEKTIPLKPLSFFERPGFLI